MVRLTHFVAAFVLGVALAGCGSQNVSFKNAGDDRTPGDFAGPEPTPGPTPTPCVGNCDPNLITGQDLFFQQPSNGRVDILFVDDNSGSMVQEQINLSTKFQTFISSLQDLDWQIGVTNTDVSNDQWGVKGGLIELWNNPGRKILTKNVSQASKVFENTIRRQETVDCESNLNVCPSGDEQPLFASILSMDKRNTENSGFFRTGSDLAIVVLSDEDEMSDGPSQATKPKDVLDKFKSIWGQEKKLSVFGIIIKPGDQACLTAQRNQAGGTGSFGQRVHTLSHMTGGTTGSICDADYSDTLREIGQTVRELNDSFELAHVPEPGTVRVSLTPNQNVNWNVDGNKVKFRPAPASGTRIEITYQYYGP